MSLNPEQTRNIVEAALMAAGQPLSIDRLLSLFMDEQQPTRDELRQTLKSLQQDCENRGVELVEVGSGFRYQAKQDYAHWVARLWEEKPPRYSRALLEILALIAYRQPITRGEIEDVRGVSVSTNIIKTLLERDWVKVVGHRDVPGKPAMYATSKQFLDYFSLKNLGELPSLAEIRDIDTINAEMNFAELDSDKESAGQAADQKVEMEFASDETEEDVISDSLDAETDNDDPMSEIEGLPPLEEKQYQETDPA